MVLPGGLGGIAAGGGWRQEAEARRRQEVGRGRQRRRGHLPMQGTIVKVVVEEGQEVAEGDTVVVIEAMKMEQPLKAHKAGTVTGLQAEVGADGHQRRGHLRSARTERATLAAWPPRPMSPAEWTRPRPPSASRASGSARGPG